MNNFIKQAAARVRKPQKTLDRPTERNLRKISIRFDFVPFYYNHQALFRKEENTLDTVAKSLLVLGSFRYEAHVLRALVRALAGKAHVFDVFFVPVGWLTGTGAPAPETHAAVEVCTDHPQGAVNALVRAALAPFSVGGVLVADEGPVTVRQFPVSWLPGDDAPVCVVAVYPFDPDCAVGIVFLGRHGDAHCGVTYLIPRAQLHVFVSAVRAHVSATYLVNDSIGHFSTTCIPSTEAPRRFPARTCTTLCEVLVEFDPAAFAPATAPPVAACTPYIPKMLVSIVDLPSDTEITCASHGGLDFVTHIGGTRLKTVLVLAKEPFARDIVFSGVFTKRNLVWRGRYTYAVTSASFPFPALKTRPGARAGAGASCACHKHCAMDSAFTTRTFAHVV
uniref:Poxvirus F5/Telomere-binding protein I6 domain-containing protein n=1 Tax=Rousettus bat poxvirus TaxID=3141933 RepID=A0AAU7E2J6_9POXV